MPAKRVRRPAALILFCLAAPGAAGLGSPEPAAIDAVFAEYDSTSTPGCALGVYRDEQVLYTRGYGMANLEHDIAIAADTVFRIASTSKQFTAMVMALLAEQGSLSLDDDIHAFFPELPDYGAPVTVRQLIHHTSGVRDYLTLTWLADWPEVYSNSEALGMILRQQQLNFPPGTDHLYSNSGYFLLSQIVENITGQSLRDWSAEHLFGPLGMRDSHFHDDHTHVVRRRANGYDLGEDGEWHTSMTRLNMVGDGGVYTTVRDLARWNRNFYDNRLGDGDPALISLMEMPGRLSSGEPLDYAFGLGIGEISGVREIAHGGAFVGFRAGFNRYPETHLGVAVLCNNARTDPTTLAREVARLYLGPGNGAAAAEMAAKNDAGAGSPSPVAISSEALRRVTGDYLDPETFMSRSIALEGDELFYVRSDDNRSRLDALGGARFRMVGVPAEVIVSFQPDDAEPATMTVELDGARSIRMERFERVSPAAEDLAFLAGTYYSEELDHTLEFAVRDGQLFASRRQGPQSLQAIREHLFTTEDGAVYEFSAGENGTAPGFRVHAGRVRNLLYRRIPRGPR